MINFAKCFMSSFVVVGAGFLLPFLLLHYLAKAPVELSVVAGWVGCSLLIAYLMVEDKGSNDKT